MTLVARVCPNLSVRWVQVTLRGPVDDSQCDMRERNGSLLGGDNQGLTAGPGQDTGLMDVSYHLESFKSQPLLLVAIAHRGSSANSSRLMIPCGPQSIVSFSLGPSGCWEPWIRDFVWVCCVVRSLDCHRGLPDTQC